MGNLSYKERTIRHCGRVDDSDHLGTHRANLSPLQGLLHHTEDDTSLQRDLIHPIRFQSPQHPAHRPLPINTQALLSPDFSILRHMAVCSSLDSGLRPIANHKWLPYFLSWPVVVCSHTCLYLRYITWSESGKQVFHPVASFALSLPFSFSFPFIFPASFLLDEC